MRAIEALRAICEVPYAKAARALFRIVAGFAGVSGLGLVIDFAIFQPVYLAGVHPSLANFISSTTGTTFVYFLSVRIIFRYDGRFLFAKWLAYIVYEALLITIVSIAIGKIGASVPGRAWLVKIALTPFTFVANFIFMSFLTGYFDRRVKQAP